VVTEAICVILINFVMWMFAYNFYRSNETLKRHTIYRRTISNLADYNEDA
jgi:hypothetical protein